MGCHVPSGENLGTSESLCSHSLSVQWTVCWSVEPRPNQNQGNNDLIFCFINALLFEAEQSAAQQRWPASCHFALRKQLLTLISVLGEKRTYEINILWKEVPIDGTQFGPLTFLRLEWSTLLNLTARHIKSIFMCFAEEEWTVIRAGVKAPTLRLTRGSYRKHPYGRYWRCSRIVNYSSFFNTSLINVTFIFFTAHAGNKKINVSLKRTRKQLRYNEVLFTELSLLFDIQTCSSTYDSIFNVLPPSSTKVILDIWLFIVLVITDWVPFIALTVLT